MINVFPGCHGFDKSNVQNTETLHSRLVKPNIFGC